MWRRCCFSLAHFARAIHRLGRVCRVICDMRCVQFGPQSCWKYRKYFKTTEPFFALIFFFFFGNSVLSIFSLSSMQLILPSRSSQWTAVQRGIIFMNVKCFGLHPAKNLQEIFATARSGYSLDERKPGNVRVPGYHLIIIGYRNHSISGGTAECGKPAIFWISFG